MESSAALQLTLLGGFALQRRSQPIAVAASGQRLIALLALRGRPLARLRVAESLWPESPAKRSLADLRTTLWRVNQCGETIVSATQATLALNPDIDVDVRRLTVLTRQLGQSGTRLTPLALDSLTPADLTSDLLPDCYDEWVLEQRECLRQIRLHGLEALSAALSRHGRHADAIQAALAAIRMEPLRETAHRTLIQAHIAEGNWSEARRQFHECQRLLKRELGVAPSASMRRLVETNGSLVLTNRPLMANLSVPRSLMTSA